MLESVEIRELAEMHEPIEMRESVEIREHVEIHDTVEILRPRRRRKFSNGFIFHFSAFDFCIKRGVCSTKL